MGLKQPVEILYLELMLKWERTAPPDRHQGILDGDPARNSQTARMARILVLIGAGSEEHVYQTLATYSRRRDGSSYVSKGLSGLREPYPLSNGWFLDGNQSLENKQEILRHLTKVGLSSIFVACADDFVAGKSVEQYRPTEAESRLLAEAIHQEQEADR